MQVDLNLTHKKPKSFVQKGRCVHTSQAGVEARSAIVLISQSKQQIAFRGGRESGGLLEAAPER